VRWFTLTNKERSAAGKKLPVVIATIAREMAG